jgi:hypothetical protein
VARQQALEQRYGPLLESLREDGVIRVAKLYY